MNHPGGAICAFGGAVIVQVAPEHVKAGKIVLWPKALPCVVTTDPSIEIADAVPEVTVIVIVAPYAQSLLSIVYVGRARPESK